MKKQQKNEMKRSFTILTAALVLFAFLALPMGMMGQTRDVETFTFSEMGYGNAENVTTVEGDNVTLTFDAGTNASNSPKYYNTGSGVRMYTGNTLEVALNDQTGDTRITAIDFTFSGSSYTGGLEDWTGSETSHTFTATGTARIQVIAVTFTDGGTPTPTTYTVTYDCNGGTTGCPENVTGIEAGEEITLANAPTKDGFDFDGWNDGNNTYDAGDEYTVNGNVTFIAQWTAQSSGDEHWVLTDLADLTSTDVFVIVGNNGSNYAMKNTDASNSGPAAIAVTVSGTELSGNVPDNIKWNISGDATNGYTFYPNGSTTTWLYCTNTNNGVRIGGTNANKTFVVDHDYLKHTFTSRYVGIYSSQDWRCYASYTATNIANQTFAFYKKVSGTVPPSITANNVEIAYDATSGEIAYTLNNPVTDGSLSVSENVDWISNAVLNTTESKVTFTTTANEANTSREGIITITYTYGDNETVSKDVTVTQAAAPVIYTTIPDLFAAATGTETSVLVTFNNWVVSGVSSNGKNVFVTDNNGNGFVIYYTTDMSSTFAAGNILSGTAVSCTLKKYNGFAELLDVTATDLTITSGGTVAVADVAMADLAGVNTGALLHYDNLTCVLTTNQAGTTTFYNLTDGTTTMQVYNAIYAFGTLVEGKTYNITGIYQQYNNTKEILPRSAEDIEEVEVQHQEYTLTVSDLSHVNLFIFGGEESETIISTEDGETTAQVYDGTEVTVSIEVEEGYVFQSLTITDANGDPVETEELETNVYYGFTMPASNVTITASAEVLTGSQYELYNGDELVEGDYLIVYDGVAMNNEVISNRLQYEEVTEVDGVITTDNAAIVWHIAPSGDYWTIYSADVNAYAASTGAKSKAQLLADGTDDKALWTVDAIVKSEVFDFINKYNADNNVNAYLRNNKNATQNFGFACYGTNTGGALSLYKKVETPVTETYTLDIAGYGNSDGGYYLIASPVASDVTPSAENGFITDAYDLYWFDQTQEAEWQNYKAGEGFDLVNGMGYLYASQANTTLTFTGEPYDGDGSVSLVKDNDAQFSGWNLVGNPFGVSAYIDRDFYIMNPETGAELIQSSGQIAPMQGIFVIANEDCEDLTFNTEAPATGGEKIVLNIMKNRGTSARLVTIDRAILRLGQGGMLPKFQLNLNSTKVYFTEGDQEFAVVSSANESEMPVSFKASENGSYIFSANTEEVEMEYLHLIDNLTGADIDLLANPYYTFEANTTDQANRFQLVFRTFNGVSEKNESNFVFFNGSEWVVNTNGEATLQVIDVTGRVLSSERINGSYNNSLNLSAGVYVLRLSNGNDVKTQKIVID